MLRYWEEEFDCIKPQKSNSKQRLYRRKDVETIMRIKSLLYEDKFTIAGARIKLREQQSTNATDNSRRISDIVDKLKEARDEIASIVVWINK